MKQGLEFLKRMLSVLLMIASISLIMVYERIVEIMLKRMELEIIWNHLSNFGM